MKIIFNKYSYSKVVILYGLNGKAITNKKRGILGSGVHIHMSENLPWRVPLLCPYQSLPIYAKKSNICLQPHQMFIGVNDLHIEL